MASKKNKPLKPPIKAPVKATAKAPVKTVKPVETFTNDSNLNIGKFSISYKWMFYSILLLFSIVLIAGALKLGVAADEAIDYEYGKASLKFYTTLGKDTAYKGFKVYKYKKAGSATMKYYGTFVEMIAPAIKQMFPTVKELKVHHLVSVFFCLLLLFYTGQVARVAINDRAAVLALLLLGLTPVILGNGFFNSKDIPLSAAYIMSIYYSIRLFQSFPNLNRGLIAGWIGALTLSIAVRVGGIVLIPLSGCFLLFILLTTPEVKKAASQIKLRWFAVLSASVLFAFVLSGLTYPNFWHEGFSHFTKALDNFKQFPTKITMLYQGDIVLSTKIDTSSFLLNYIWISFPEIVLLLTVIGSLLLLASPLIKKPIGWFILLTGWFPIVYVIAINAFIYNGWRHVMFAYPSIIIISVYAASYFYQKFNSSTVVKYVITAVLILSIIDLTVYNVEAFPYNYFYFNHLEGGIPGAYNNYDLDYQQLATTDAFDWLKNHSDISKKDSNRIFSNNTISLFYTTRDTIKYKLVQTGLVDMYALKWDYAIVSNNFQPVKFIKFSYPPKGTLYTVKRFGVPLAYVVKRRNVEYLDSLHLVDKGKYDRLLPILQQEYKSNPANLFDIYWMAFCYYKENNYDESLRLLDTVDKYHPRQTYTQELYGFNYYNKKEYDKAINSITRIYNTNPNNVTYNQILYFSLMNLGHTKQAQRFFARARIQVNQAAK